MPAIMLSRVDLPQPEGPISDTNAPSGMERSTGLNAWITEPLNANDLETALISIDAPTSEAASGRATGQAPQTQATAADSRATLQDLSTSIQCDLVWRSPLRIDWHRSISSARLIGPLAVGSAFKWKSGGLDIESIVQALEPIHRVSWTGRSLGTEATHRWVLEPLDGATLVTTEESMEGWLVSVLKLLAPGFLDKSLDAWLRDLKLKAEQTGT